MTLKHPINICSWLLLSHMRAFHISILNLNAEQQAPQHWHWRAGLRDWCGFCFCKHGPGTFLIKVRSSSDRTELHRAKIIEFKEKKTFEYICHQSDHGLNLTTNLFWLFPSSGFATGSELTGAFANCFYATCNHEPQPTCEERGGAI